MMPKNRPPLLRRGQTTAGRNSARRTICACSRDLVAELARGGADAAAIAEAGAKQCSTGAGERLKPERTQDQKTGSEDPDDCRPFW